MNTDELNFAYKVRHALNETLDELPPSTTERLAAARQLALSRKKADAPARVRVRQAELVTEGGGGFFSQQFSWFLRAGVILPLLMLVAGMVGLYQHEQKQHVAELAELDAAVLSDELPLSAYLDHGFNAYLDNKREQ
jgi:hypothetical protein